MCWSLRRALCPAVNRPASSRLQGAWAFLGEPGTCSHQDTEQDKVRGTVRGHWRGRRAREDFSEEGTVELTGTGRKTIPGRKTINANCEPLPG